MIISLFVPVCTSFQSNGDVFLYITYYIIPFQMYNSESFNLDLRYTVRNTRRKEWWLGHLNQLCPCSRNQIETHWKKKVLRVVVNLCTTKLQYHCFYNLCFTTHLTFRTKKSNIWFIITSWFSNVHFFVTFSLKRENIVKDHTSILFSPLITPRRDNPPLKSYVKVLSI